MPLSTFKRDELKDIYDQHADRLKEEIQRQLEIARIFETELDVQGAVRTYLRTYPLYESLKEAEIIQIGAEYRPDSRTAFRRLAERGNPNERHVMVASAGNSACRKTCGRSHR